MLGLGLGLGLSSRLGMNTNVAYIPAGLGWTGPNFIPRKINGVWRSGLNPITLVNPAIWNGVPYYVDIATGSDSNSGLSWAQAKKSIYQAVNAGNANGSATAFIVNVKAGDYDLTTGFSGPSASVRPTKPVAYIADGGRVRYTTANISLTWSAYSGDAYQQTVNEVGFVVDTRDGTILQNVADAATVVATPGSWSEVSGVCYAHLLDGAVVSTANTRVVRWVRGCCFPTSISVGDIYIQGFDLQGGRYGAIDLSPAALGNTVVTRNSVVVDCTGSLAGRPTGPADGIRVSYNTGLCAVFNSSFYSNQNDGLNWDEVGGSDLSVLTENCSAYDNGYFGQLGNAYSGHANVVGIDLSGTYQSNTAQAFYNINTTKWWALGLDTTQLNAIAALRSGNTSTIWVQDAVATGGTISAQCDVGSFLYYRSTQFNGPVVANGTFAPF